MVCHVTEVKYILLSDMQQFRCLWILGMPLALKLAINDFLSRFRSSIASLRAIKLIAMDHNKIMALLFRGLSLFNVCQSVKHSEMLV